MRDWFNAQKLNVFLWSPIFLALGMATYFSITNEPSIITLAVLFIIGIFGTVLLRHIPFVTLAMCLFTGFGYAGIYTHIKNTTLLSHDIHGTEITGRVTDIEYVADKTRIHLKTDNFGNVRVSTSEPVTLHIGDIISGTGGLFKTKPADTPGGFDFARNAYFNNLTAIGYIKDVKTVYTADSHVYSPREYIKDKTNSFLADALILGYKNSLNRPERDTWSKNGVAHLWSISGYHMGLVAGWLFIIFYMIFRCIPKLVRRVPARIPATICSWVGLVGYVCISGGGVATLRAFTMTSLVMLAIIVGRNAISLRITSLAFIILTIINP